MPDAPFVSITEILRLVQDRTGVAINRANLSAKVLAGRLGRESMLERLNRQGLARTLQRGSRKDWEISTAALDQLIERASGRPGPGPGAQITLTAEQVLTFAKHLTDVGQADPSVIEEALRRATGLADQQLVEVRRIVIPREPRRPRHSPDHA